MDLQELMKRGPSAWNAWRNESGHVGASLRQCDFERLAAVSGPYEIAEFEGYDLSNTDLHAITARNCIFSRCTFDHSRMNGADLCYSTFLRCSFVGVEMRVAKIGSARFEECVLDGSDLAYCSAEETSFSRSRLVNSSLNHVTLVKADFSNAEIKNTTVYGISAWDLRLDGCRQRGLVISEQRRGAIMVDDIEIAQFIHLLVRNARVRHIIDTITTKVVLVLGRFTPQRKAVLEKIRRRLRARNYIPVIFDFDCPDSRDLTETVTTLAHLSRFVVADLTDPRSIPHELSVIVPTLPSVPVQPILAAGESTFAMFEHFRRYPWVLPIIEYASVNVKDVVDGIVAACEERLTKP